MFAWQSESPSVEERASLTFPVCATCEKWDKLWTERSNPRVSQGRVDWPTYLQMGDASSARSARPLFVTGTCTSERLVRLPSRPTCHIPSAVAWRKDRWFLVFTEESVSSSSKGTARGQRRRDQFARHFRSAPTRAACVISHAAGVCVSCEGKPNAWEANKIREVVTRSIAHKAVAFAAYRP